MGLAAVVIFYGWPSSGAAVSSENHSDSIRTLGSQNTLSSLNSYSDSFHTWKVGIILIVTVSTVLKII